MSRSHQEQKQRQREMNPVTIARLIAKGVDASEPRDLVHVFHVFKSSDGELLSVELERRGYRVVSRGKEHSHECTTYWLVKCVANAPPVVSVLDLLTNEFVDIAVSFDADYDGWYTKVDSPL